MQWNWCVAKGDDHNRNNKVRAKKDTAVNASKNFAFPMFITTKKYKKLFLNLNQKYNPKKYNFPQIFVSSSGAGASVWAGTTGALSAHDSNKIIYKR